MDKYTKIAVLTAIARAGQELSTLEIVDKVPYSIVDICTAISAGINEGLIQTAAAVGKYDLTPKGRMIASGEE